MSRKYLFLLILLLPLQGCSFSVKILGRVIDKETGRLILGATVNLLEGRDIKKTDKAGFFEVFSETGPFQDPTILVTKDGYKPFQIRIEGSDEETTYTVKSESIFIDYEEPVFPEPNKRETFITGAWIDKWSKEFKTGDTLTIYLVRDNRKAEIERAKEKIENIK